MKSSVAVTILLVAKMSHRKRVLSILKVNSELVSKLTYNSSFEIGIVHFHENNTVNS